MSAAFKPDLFLTAASEHDLGVRLSRVRAALERPWKDVQWSKLGNWSADEVSVPEILESVSPKIAKQILSYQNLLNFW